jgi:hypothetical protein
MSVKSIFFRDDEGQKPSSKADASKTSKTTDSAAPATTTLPPTFSGIPGMVNEKILNSLQDVIKRNNIPGIDYYEFSLAVSQLNNIIPDEKTRFQAAYATLKSSGEVSKTVLMTSIDTYSNLISKERESFTADLKRRYDENVGKRNKGIGDAQKRITDIQKELTSLSQFVIEETQNVQQEELKLKQIESNFEASITHLLTCLTSDKDKINNYIS